MRHHLIPARNAAIAEALAEGQSVAEIAQTWRLAESTVLRMRGDANAPPAPYEPSQSALEVLADMGWDIDSHLRVRPGCSERDAALLEAFLTEGLTLQRAGLRFDLTRERVRQVVARHTGIRARDLANLRQARRAAQAQGAAFAALADLTARDPEATVRDLARATGLTRTEVLTALGDEALSRRDAHSWSVGADEADVLAEIRRVAALAGERPLTGPFYDRHRAPGAISAVRVSQRYGTWTEACRVAGVASKPSVRSTYTHRWTREELLDWADRAVSDLGPGVSFRQCEGWLRARKSDGAPSAQTVRNAFGSWVGLLAVVGQRRTGSIPPASAHVEHQDAAASGT